MEPLKIKGTAAHGPEAEIQSAIMRYLEVRHWLVIRITASEFLKGLPDLYCTHKDYKARWVEVKLPNMVGSKFTPAQLKMFPRLCAYGAGVWILTAATDFEYQKLWQKPNWEYYRNEEYHRARKKLY